MCGDEDEISLMWRGAVYSLELRIINGQSKLTELIKNGNDKNSVHLP